MKPGQGQYLSQISGIARAVEFRSELAEASSCPIKDRPNRRVILLRGVLLGLDSGYPRRLCGVMQLIVSEIDIWHS
jgi:hypothetical protein